MKSIFLLNERLTQGSPSVFFDLLSQNQQYNFHRLYLSKLRAKEIRIPNKKKLADLLTPTRIHVIKDLIDKYNCFLIFSTGLISDFWTGFFIKNPKRVCFIRGHLPEVYSFRFRWMKTGYFLGILHYFIATRFDKVIVMTQSMKRDF